MGVSQAARGWKRGLTGPGSRRVRGPRACESGRSPFPALEDPVRTRTLPPSPPPPPAPAVTQWVSSPSRTSLFPAIQCGPLGTGSGPAEEDPAQLRQVVAPTPVCGRAVPRCRWPCGNLLFDVAHLCRARRGGNPGRHLVHSLVCWGCGLERGRQGRCFMQPTFCPKGGSPHLCGFLAQARGFGQIETAHLPRGPRRCQLLPGSPPRCL